MRFWLVTVPARIVDTYFAIWRVVIAGTMLVLFVQFTVMLVLYGFGIRWGW